MGGASRAGGASALQGEERLPTSGAPARGPAASGQPRARDLEQRTHQAPRAAGPRDGGSPPAALSHCAPGSSQQRKPLRQPPCRRENKSTGVQGAGPTHRPAPPSLLPSSPAGIDSLRPARARGGSIIYTCPLAQRPHSGKPRRALQTCEMTGALTFSLKQCLG